MNKLLRRSSRLLKKCVKSLTTPAVDPRQTFVNVYERQRELLLKVQQALGAIQGSKARLEPKIASAEARLTQLEENAVASLRKDREDLARLSLKRRQLAAAELQSVLEQLQEIEQEELRLSLIEQRLSTQIEAFYARQEVVAARYSAAEAQVRIQEAYSGVSQELADLGHALAQAEERSERMQARAAAIDRLVDDGILDGPSANPVSGQISQLNAAQDVEEQLARLKEQLSQA